MYTYRLRTNKICDECHTPFKRGYLVYVLQGYRCPRCYRSWKHRTAPEKHLLIADRLMSEDWYNKKK